MEIGAFISDLWHEFFNGTYFKFFDMLRNVNLKIRERKIFIHL